MDHLITSKKVTSRSPTDRVFLSAQWRWLVMLNWEIDPGLLEDLTPFGTELDFFEGRTFVSIVGFLFQDTRLLGIPIPLHRNFEELNLRFYIRRPEILESGEEEIRRGVSFISELVPRWAIASTARRFYNENYLAVPMQHSVEETDPKSGSNSDSSISVEYRWKFNDRWSHVSATGTGQAQPLIHGSLEQFIAEHYWGYSQQRNGTSFEYRVRHPAWKVWQVSDVEFECDIENQYGNQFSKVLSRTPDSAFIADGSAVTVSRPRRIR